MSARPPAMIIGSQPILSCDESRTFEAQLFGGEEAREWPAMQRAGRAIAAAVRRDFEEIGGFPTAAHVLVLVGKGHNGGDALIAMQALLEAFPAARAEVVFAFGERALRPLAAQAWRETVHVLGGRVKIGRADATDQGYDLCLDGIFGFQFRPPADPQIIALIERVNTLPIRLRAAVDLPSAGLFRADFTYATGIVKAPVVGAAEAGRVRYLDLGFFGGGEAGQDRVLTTATLTPLAGLRSSHTDKRTFGHVFVMGGSRGYPGAVLMAVLAALRSGAGLVTAFVPESLVPAFAARVPEAMWVAWPETPQGGLALEGQHLMETRLKRANALVIGPGLGREPETLALVRDLVTNAAIPLVLDADALQPEIVRAGIAPRVLTPHAGEWARIGGGVELRDLVRENVATMVAKGPVTRVCGGAEVYHSFFGGPVLARGGSGDILAGLIGGLLAQAPDDPLLAAARGVVWHGLAADALARAHGQVAVQTTQVLDYLSVALREALA